ncbi:hypothetical protein ACN6K4_006536 [Streptomyces hayashii]|uniref:hypothetical protein n=1 Tax=Streptomyces hayashii TaxID=2839966 RepID=UPI00403CF270
MPDAGPAPAPAVQAVRQLRAALVRRNPARQVRPSRSALRRHGRLRQTHETRFVLADADHRNPTTEKD